MSKSVLALVRDNTSSSPKALESLLAHPKIREMTRIRASKMKGFPWERIPDRRLDAQRAIWETVSRIDKEKVREFTSDSVAAAYLSRAVRNRMFLQVRSDLGLREATVVDDFGESRFQLVPKIARGPFDEALRKLDATADPCRLIMHRESIEEIGLAVESAPMSLPARRVLTWRMAGLSGKEMNRRLGRCRWMLYKLLREARQAVRGQLYSIRKGHE
ncbi:MAG: hypothetical protein HY815_29020 [Candidatus Riflebacteria bacterium]|nr:hypothetical protein [Candidatus Riflebacteria bacterium]